MKRTHMMPVLAVLLIACQASGDDRLDRRPDVIFVPTPEPVVKEMLTMADVDKDDVVYDLGCGDGRIAIAAARDFGARAVCVDIDPKRIREARANVENAGMGDRVEVRHADLFQTDVSDATVVTLYLLDSLNERLRPKLRKELRPGARVVSQTFDMGEWQPDETREVSGKQVYLWTIEGENNARRQAPKEPRAEAEASARPK